MAVRGRGEGPSEGVEGLGKGLRGRLSEGERRGRWRGRGRGRGNVAD